jgi:hypothetical protein
LPFEVGPHRAFVLNQENRPPKHGSKLATASRSA